MNTIREIIADHIRYREQLPQLALSDLKNSYKDSVLGWLWTVIKPAINIAMRYFAFVVGLGIAHSVNGFPYFFWFIAGLIPWFYLSEVFVTGAYSLRKYSYLITKIRFPISTIPTFVSLSHMVTHLALMVILFAIFMISGYQPDVYWLQLPFYTLVMYLFFRAWSLFAGVLSCFSRDFYNLTRSLTSVLLWVSAVFYDAERISNPIARELVNINPVTYIVTGYRDALVNHVWFWDKPLALLRFGILYAILVFLAVSTYGRLKERIPDVL